MKYFIASLLFFWSLGVSAQHDFTASVDAYEKAKSSLFLLKNEKAKIPLLGEDVFKINHFYNENLRELPALMDLYYPVESHAFEVEAILSTYVNSSGIIIVSIDLSSFYLNEKKTDLLEKALSQENIITLVYGSESEFQKSTIDFSKCSHLLYVNGRTKLQQSLAVQTLFGGIDIRNTLSEDLTNSFKKGNGFTLKGNLRLGYAPPESVGMDRNVLNEKIDPIVKMAIDSGAFPGCQIIIAKNQKVIFHKSWGHHTYDQKQAVALNDIYDFASVTKVTSALPALMKLHGEGKVSLDDPLGKYFPKFKNTNKANLPIRSILAHNAKLKPWIPYWRSTIKKNGKYKWRTFKKRKSRRFPTKVTDHLYLHRKYKKKIYKAIKESPLNEKSGYVYSGLAFYLWPEIVSELVNEDFEIYLKKTFYQPIGASTITYNPDDHFPLNRIVLTENDTFFRKVQIHGKVHDEGAAMMGGVSANAGLFGSANDLAKLMQLYLNEGTYAGERLIAAASVKEFTTCHYCEEGNRRGLGFDKPLIEYHPQKSSVAKDASPSSYGHSGYTGTFTWVDPEHDLIYIFFSNRVYPTRENRKIYQLNVRPDIHQLIYDSFLSADEK